MIRGNNMKKELPYIETKRVIIEKKYNPNYGDSRVCKCGHIYYYHFDTYEHMSLAGCKHCGCIEFEEVDGGMIEIDLDAECWKMIKQAASESNWIPPQYFQNDWVSDVCAFLRTRNERPKENKS